MKRSNKSFVIAAGLLAGSFILTGCGEEGVRNDEQQTNRQLQKYQVNQPVPEFDWSQQRETLIGILNAQANTVATTTFFFNQGVEAPIKQCSSIGLPVPSTAQLTNPDQYYSSGGVLAQQEPNGVYTGDSSGTYVTCVNPAGQAYVVYWEGNTHAEGGPARWDEDLRQVVLDGDPTANVATGRE